MPDAERDEDLELAITMSLQRSPSAVSEVPPTLDAPIDLTSDNEEDDEDLRRAIELSIQETTRQAAVVDSQEKSPQPSEQANPISGDPIHDQQPSSKTASTTPPACAGLQGLLGLDRKTMERERFARLGKRKRDPSPDRPSKQGTCTSIGGPPKVTSASASPSNTALRYPKGVIRRTFATKYPRTSDITVDELLQAPTLHIAVISSFMWDAEWLHKKLDPRRIKQVWVMNAKGRDVQERWTQEMKDNGVPNLKIHFPPMNGMIQSMHSKFMLLFGKDKLRLVVPTANMTQIDWGEVANDWQPGVMENSVFLIDLPRRIDGQVGRKNDLSNFGQNLVNFLEQQEISQDVIAGVLKFDFSQTTHLAFVHSVGGTHDSKADHHTGLPGLAQAVRDLQLDKVKDIELDYAAASLGAINDTLLQRIYLAARGENFTVDSQPGNVRDKMQIYFPTKDTVENSIGGPDCGGIISLRSQHYNAPAFPKECLRDYDSTRRGMLSHNKLLFARGRNRDGKPFAWVYIGSANMSESAWGSQKILKSGKMGNLNIRNWECGVVVPVHNDRFEHVIMDERGIPPMSVFDGTIEVPFHYPGQKYGGKQPWFRPVG